MLTKIVNGFMHFISAIALLWGAGLLFAAIMTPSQYNMYSASAVQATQVYSEAMMYGLQACAMFLLAILLQIVVYVGRSNSEDALKLVADNTERTNIMLAKVGKMLSNK